MKHTKRPDIANTLSDNIFLAIGTPTSCQTIHYTTITSLVFKKEFINSSSQVTPCASGVIFAVKEAKTIPNMDTYTMTARDCQGVSHDLYCGCLFNNSFKLTSKNTKSSTLLDILWWESTADRGFPSLKASNVESIIVSWHLMKISCPNFAAPTAGN